MSSDQLVFEWSEVKSDCPVFQYRITSLNCGQCPDSTINMTATCSGNFTTSRLGPCLFAVQSVLCGDIGGDMRTTTIGLSTRQTDVEFNTETSPGTGCIQGM